MDARRKERLECSSGPAVEGGGEDRFLLSGEIMDWELICHLELLKITLLVGEKFSSGAPLLGSQHDGNRGEKAMEGDSCLSGTWPMPDKCFAYLISFNP